MSVPVCRHSRGQKSVTLSTTEAEYVACSEVVKEVLFILQLLKHLRVEVKLPILVHVDNIGAIFLAEIKIAVIGQNTWIQDIILCDNI